MLFDHKQRALSNCVQQISLEEEFPEPHVLGNNDKAVGNLNSSSHYKLLVVEELEQLEEILVLDQVHDHAAVGHYFE